MENSHNTGTHGENATPMPPHFFKKSGIPSDYSTLQSSAGDGFKCYDVGIERSIRDNIVTSALRAAGVVNPVILPETITRR